ncbi:hypothetical protein NDU88_007411 [Pleurodeles waltl]|uniref:Protein FADD n=1 Tax=Pleurodeles waltl TaxID=8319 RepID=A0AAV7TZY5_PLEWA|nr:hypothetical protein NDU88_007411 [Pleurodeles waltl]
MSKAHSYLPVTEKELDELKFLCREKIGKRKLESVKSGVDLFTILLEMKEISLDQLDWLRRLLSDIQREDLVEQLDSFAENGIDDTGDQPEPREREKLTAAFQVICENVGKDWRTLIRRLRVPEARVDGIVAAYPLQMREQLMQSLKEWQKRNGANANVAELLAALRGSKMKLVAEIVEEELSKL